ncbi:MAG: hypothetical protein WBZ11_05835 [Candidatus Sulfotelmatobacter sp.]
MMWEETTVPAVRRGERVTSLVRFTTNGVCAVEITVDDVDSRGEGPDLFEALAQARRGLEAEDLLVGCNGARRDVFPSAMQRQAGFARRAYVLTMPRTTARPEVVDIFASASELSALATVDAQRAWFDRWRQSRPVEEGSR